MILLLAALAAIGFKVLNPTAKTGSAEGGTRVVDKAGNPLVGGPLTDRTGRIGRGGPLTNKSGLATPAPPNPQDVIDYLEFLRKIEQKRVMMSKKQLGRLLAMSPKMMVLGAGSAIDSGEPEIEARQTVKDFQTMGSEFNTEWQNLAREFLAKTPPQSCVQLQTKYYDVLGKTSGTISKAMSAFNQAMSGNAGSALDALTGMRGSGAGSASQSVGEACVSADEELANVCDKFKIHKDFSIQDDGGGANLLGH